MLGAFGCVARQARPSAPHFQDVNRDAYSDTANGYSAIRTLIRREMLAVLYILGRKGEAMAALLLEPFAGQRTSIFAAMKRQSEASGATGEGEEQGEDGVQALTPQALHWNGCSKTRTIRPTDLQDLAQQARKARQQIHRKGFRTEDSEADAATMRAIAGPSRR